MIYLKVLDPGGGQKEKLNGIKRTIIFLAGLILPKANPDFENKIDLVVVWLIEFLDESSTPEREIGLNKAGDVILKMPYRKNYGFWTDNTMLLADFQKSFSTEFISKDEFELAWNSAFTDDDLSN